jgi:hypothetical protein
VILDNYQVKVRRDVRIFNLRFEIEEKSRRDDGRIPIIPACAGITTPNPDEIAEA